MGSDDVDRTRQANESLSEVAGAYDEFYCLAAIPIAAGGEIAAEEFERAISDGCNGGAIEVSPLETALTDRSYEPVLERADRFGAPILVHPKLDDSLSAGVLDDSYRLNAIFGREVALAESICKVVQHDLLESYPNVSLVYHHLGGNVASMYGRIRLQLDADRWPAYDRSVEFDEFAGRVRENVHVDTSGFFGHGAPLRETLKRVSPENIHFGSDYPYEPRTPTEMDDLIGSIESLVDGPALDGILGENSRRILLERD
ncbi:amidohydrolase family protein [Natrarchaeobius sp. A-rgal3]|uniref:amidohydrolase family protein n=1 Tax=Natrarchaeobius versutus TaxID=1679078 RepID=UPI00350F23DF